MSEPSPRRDPRLSVIVCTHNRRVDLERCLEAFSRLDDPVELIVVDSASNPPVEQLVAAYRDRIANLVYRYEPAAGLSAARNRGVHAATAAIVAFVDDDAAPEQDWARRITAAFDNPRVGCVGGACRARFEAPPPRWLSPRLLQFAGITMFGDTPRPAASRSEWPFGANLAFRRAALDHAGGFDERLGRVGTLLLSGEESAVISRVAADGWLVWLEPAAIVNHTVNTARLESRYYWRRLWWAGVGRGRVQASLALAARLAIAVPVRLVLWAATGDRLYLYRLAESAGYFTTLLRRVGGARA
jgi:glucosyl-dolichyl phosphate glucuronosyltransferase